MKYLEILEQTLNEINMSPSSLRQAAANIEALAGMEFEMIIPNVETDVEPEMEVDMDQDQRTRSFRDIRDFFHDGDYNGRREVDNLMEEIDAEYGEWKQEQITDSWDSEGLDFLRDYISLNDLFDRDEALDTARDEIMDANPDLPPESEDFQKLLSARLDELEEEFVQQELDNQGRIHNDAFEEFSDEKQSEDAEEEFLDERYPYMSDVQSNFDISWPHYYDINADSSGMDGQLVADEFSSFMGKPVNYSSSYHGGKREPGTYVVEPDGSLEGDEPGDGGLEFVSPPMPIDEMLADLKKVKAWADKAGAYTNDSTGLHINVSVPNYSLEKLDFVKLAILLGDERVLNEFGRMGNTYAKSALQIVKQNIQQRPEDAEALLNKMKEHLSTAAAKSIHSGTTSKYTSINTKTGYIEFRSPGGDWLSANFELIEPTLLRFVVALDAALDETKYQTEYAKKLYKLLAPGSTEPGILELFANFSAGELDKAALIRQIRQKQLARDVAKGKSPVGKQYWWNVQWDANRRIEVVASNKDVARQVAAEEWDVPVERLAVAKVTVIRPYEAEAPAATGTAAPALAAAQSTQGNWGIWMAYNNRFVRQPGQIDYNVIRRFPSQAAAMAFLERTREENPQMRTDVEVREIPADYRPGGRPAGSASQFQEPNAGRGDLTPRGPGPWEIYRLSDNSSVRELSNTDRMAAGEEARNALGLRGEAPELYGVRTRQAAAPAQRSEYELFLKSNGRVVTAPSGNPIIFSANSPGDAANKIARYVADFNLPGDPSNYDVRSVQQSTQQSGTAPQTLTRPGQGQERFTGEWKIVDANDREIHRFGGVGNAQADANRIAMNWLRQNPRHMQSGVQVLPVMG